MKIRTSIFLTCLCAVLLGGCAKEAIVPEWVLTPQILSTEITELGENEATFSATITSSGNLTACGFTLSGEGESREFTSNLENGSFWTKVGNLSSGKDYEVCSWVANGDYRLYSRKISFTTQKEQAKVEFLSLEAAPTDTEVTLKASVSCSEKPQGKGFILYGPDGDTRQIEAEGDGDTFSATLDGLSPETTYEWEAYLKMKDGRTLHSSRERFTTEEAAKPRPTFISVEASADIRSAYLKAKLSSGETVLKCGFILEKEGSQNIDYVSSIDGNGFSMTVEDLLPDSRYSFRAYFEDQEGREESERVSFETLPEKAQASFSSFEVEATATEAYLRATLTTSEGIESCGFGIGVVGGSIVEYEADIESLQISRTVFDLYPETDYRAYAFIVTENSEAIYSQTLYFTTKEDPSPVFDMLRAEAGIHGAVLRAKVIAKASIEERGFRLIEPDGNVRSIVSKEDSEEYSCEVEDLREDTRYEFEAYAVVGGKLYTSERKSFYTKKDSSSEVVFTSIEATIENGTVALKAVFKGGGSSIEGGFGISDNGMDYVEYSASITNGNMLERKLEGLDENKTYSCYAFIIDDGILTTSEIIQFTIGSSQ